MRVIIAGSRDFTDATFVEAAIVESGFEITEVVSGGCRGVDTLGEAWAEAHGVPVHVFKADWELLGRRAGPTRNQEMADYADALIAIPAPGVNGGTMDMIRRARLKGLPTYIRTLPASFTRAVYGG